MKGMKLLRFLLRFGILLGLAGFVVMALALTPEPSLPTMAAPSPEDVKSTRALVRDFRKKTAQNQVGSGKPVIASLDSINGAMRMGARMIQGVRARAGVKNDQLHLQGSYPVGSLGWVNVDLVVPEFEERPEIAQLTVGRITLPPGLSMLLLELGLDLYLGTGSSERLFAALPGLTIHPDRVETRVALSREGRGDLADQLFGTLRGGEMPSAAMIDSYYQPLRQAMEAGELPETGSLLPHLRFVLTQAHAKSGSGGDTANTYTAAIFALNKACGASSFHRIVARLAPGLEPEKRQRWRRNCDANTFAGRVDSKLHFITAAAIQAASNRGVAVSVGEFKELFDSLSGGSGFDFTDIAANNSGIRLSDRMMRATPEAWPLLLEQLRNEAAILPSFKTIPGRMTRADFTARYQDVNSPAYAAEMARIEARIDALPLHRPLSLE